MNTQTCCTAISSKCTRVSHS